jgi:hypothetical protein
MAGPGHLGFFWQLGRGNTKQKSNEAGTENARRRRISEGAIEAGAVHVEISEGAIEAGAVHLDSSEWLASNQSTKQEARIGD